MVRLRSFLLGLLLLVFFSCPLLGVVLWAAVFLLGYTPPFWLALVAVVVVLLNLIVLMGRRLHPSYRPR